MEEMKAPFVSVPEQGYFVDYSRKNRESEYAHIFCGTHSLEGAGCPNCHKPLLRLFSFDVRDPSLQLAPAPFTALPVLFCWTCNVAQSVFYYRINDDRGIRLLKYMEGGVSTDFPYEKYPEHFPKRPVRLIEIPRESQQIIKGLNRNTLDEWKTKQTKPELCAPRHQVGGEPYLVQKNSDAIVECLVCSAPMPFLACIADDAPNQLSFTGNEYVQVLAQYCKRCRVIGVYQQCD
jgi:hypothetical protein